MIRTLAFIGTSLLSAALSTVAFGQATDASPTFTIADVHVSAKITNPGFRSGALRGDRYELRMATMVDLIRTAYGVDADKVLGGPIWLESDRFDILAKAPPNTSPENIKLMLQALLADRFKLVLHPETKDLPGYALTAGKKPLLKEAEAGGDTGCKMVIQGIDGLQAAARSAAAQGGAPPPLPPTLTAVYTCKNMTMKAFADGMRNMTLAQQFIGNGRVVDRTELQGAWDFGFKYDLPLNIAPGVAPSVAVTLLTAVEKQLGLKLDPLKLPTPVLVVDSVNQTPSANPPGVTTSLPPTPPSEFDVADIKPSAPGAPQGGIRIQAGGRLDMQAMPLKGLITLAYDINGDEFLVGPKWLDQNHFDVIAKAAATGPNTGLDVDALRAMIRSMLADRFKMTTHYEDRPVTAYTLTAAKPKLTKADPSNRTGCKEGPGPDGKDPRISNPALSRLFYCQNITMAQFAERLPGLSTGFIRTPVLDATGLDGAYDFALSYSPTNLTNLIAAAGGRSGGPTPVIIGGGPGVAGG